MEGTGGYYDENSNNVKWDLFTKQWKNYKNAHRENKNLKTLEDFANFIIQYPSKFSPLSKKRAMFYVSSLGNKKLSNDKHIMGRRKASGGDLLDDIKGGLERVGDSFKVAGINPISLGLNLGEHVIGPALDRAGLLGGGIHIHHHHYYPSAEGEGFWDDVKHRARQVGNVAKNVIVTEGKKHLKEIAPEAIKTGATALKNLTGNRGMVNSFIDANADLANKHIQGLGMKSGRFVKGSKEAKEFMARLRSMRKK